MGCFVIDAMFCLMMLIAFSLLGGFWCLGCLLIVLLWAIDVVYCGWVMILFDLMLLYCHVYVCLLWVGCWLIFGGFRVVVAGGEGS